MNLILPQSIKSTLSKKERKIFPITKSTQNRKQLIKCFMTFLAKNKSSDFLLRIATLDFLMSSNNFSIRISFLFKFLSFSAQEFFCLSNFSFDFKNSFRYRAVKVQCVHLLFYNRDKFDENRWFHKYYGKKDSTSLRL